VATAIRPRIRRGIFAVSSRDAADGGLGLWPITSAAMHRVFGQAEYAGML